MTEAAFDNTLDSRVADHGFDPPRAFVSVPGWTDERIERLTKLYANGLSAAQIANEIGHVSRNAVLGKIHRLGLERRGRCGNYNVTRPPREERKRARAAGQATSLRPKVRHESPELKALRCAEIVPLGVGLLELERGQCRYPYGAIGEGDGVTFCGHPTEKERSYCSAHQALTTRGWVEK